MSKTEQKACLSTSFPQVPTPPSSPEPEVSAEAEEEHASGDDENETPPPVPPKPDAVAPPQPPRGPDYVLVLCYILVYLEIAWLIIMVLRSYSRD